MNEDSKKNEFKCPPWLLTGVVDWMDMVDTLVEKTKIDRGEMIKTINLFFEEMAKKLRQGHSINLSIGIFHPHFGPIDPITGEQEMQVEFIPSQKMLKKIQEERIKRLNDALLN